MNNREVLLSYTGRCPLVPHLAADAESLQRVQAEPAAVSRLLKAAHELGVERPLEGGQTHQDHVFLFGRQLVLQDVVASSGAGQR